MGEARFAQFEKHDGGIIGKVKINIGLTDKNRAGVVAILNRVLSDEYVLYTKTRNYRWNVTGPNFSERHKFFEPQYEELQEMIDQAAERSRALDGNASGTMKEFLQQTWLKEFPADDPSAEKMIANLLRDHEAIIHSLREDLVACDERYGDIGTNDFLTGLMERHENAAWMLKPFFP